MMVTLLFLNLTIVRKLMEYIICRDTEKGLTSYEDDMNVMVRRGFLSNVFHVLLIG